MASPKKVAAEIKPKSYKLKRPPQNKGTSGAPIEVVTNYVKITALPSSPVHHYSAITDKLLPRERKEKLDALYKHLLKDHLVYCSGNMILSMEKGLEKVYSVPLGTRFNKETQEKEPFLFDIELRFITSRDLNDLFNPKLDLVDMNECTHICDVLVKFDPTFKRIVRGIGQFSTNIIPISNSPLALLSGHQSHVNYTSNGPLLNVDSKYHIVFQSVNVNDALKSLPKSDLKGLKVSINSKTTHKKDATIVGWSNLNANTYKFKVDDKEMTVNEYFQSKGVQLKFPQTPLACINKKRETFYPPELLKILPHQSYPNKIPDVNMIKNQTCLVPMKRLDTIKQLLNALSSPLSHNRDLLNIPARFLSSCDAVFQQSVPCSYGSITTRNQPFLNPVEVSSWCILNFSRVPYQRIETQLIRNLLRVSQAHNVNLPSKYPYMEYNGEPIEEFLLNAYNKAKDFFKTPPELFLCMADVDPIYMEVKSLLETSSILPTLVASQFVSSAKVSKMNLQYCSNLLLKINEKLSGCSWRFSSADLKVFVQEPTMVLGMDVSHPIMKRENSYSVGSLVASMDSRFSQYSGQYGYLEGEEMTAIIPDCMEKLLSDFGTPVKRLIVFRDGLGTGDFEGMAKREIEAFHKLDIGQLVYIVVVKQHSTRFFSQSKRDTVKNGNLKNGLVVDDVITGNYMEFYLQSQNGLQGTAIPTKYIVLEDEMHLTGDELQLFTFNMCRLMQTSPAPCSQPNVVKMADKMAARVMKYDGKVELKPELMKRRFYT